MEASARFAGNQTTVFARSTIIPAGGHSLLVTMSRHAPGYLYAVMNDGGSPSRIKLGSTGALDPVHTLKHDYSRGYGQTRVLWLYPCANMHRDEHDRLHDYFGDRRVWSRSEIFAFASMDELMEQLCDFEVYLTILLRAEPRPPHITDLEGAATTAARREEAHEQRQADKRKRIAEKEEAIERRQAERNAERDKKSAEREEAAEREREEQSRHNQLLLQQLIHDTYVVGEDLWLLASEFNAAAKERGVRHGIRGAMSAEGFKLHKSRVEGKVTEVYSGLGLKVSNC